MRFASEFLAAQSHEWHQVELAACLAVIEPARNFVRE
jgi:hypothetical protein